MKKESCITALLLLLIWFLAAIVFNNSIILPGPFDVLNSMTAHVQQPDFLSVLLSTSMRTLKACFLSLGFGSLLGILSGNFPGIKLFLSPVHQLIKTIPNITYMILILIWAGQENSVSIIVFFILFPVFYAQFLNCTEQNHIKTKDLLKIYPVTGIEKWFKIDLPMLKNEFFESLKTGIGLGFKVCVMAEILSQVKTGIGKEMNVSRLNLDISSVFGWTCWLMIVSVLIQLIISIVQKITNHKIN